MELYDLLENYESEDNPIFEKTMSENSDCNSEYPGYKSECFDYKSKSQWNSNNLLCLNCMTSKYLSFDIEYNQFTCKNCGFIIPNAFTITKKKEEKDYANQSTFTDAKSIISYNMSSVKNITIQNIFRWNKATMKEIETSKMKKYIVSKCNILKIKKNVIDDVLIFYNLVMNNTFHKNRQLVMRGPNKIGLIGSCIYYAFKKNNSIISIRTISKTLNTTTRVVNKMCNVFLTVINELNKESNMYNYNFNVSVSINYLKTFINDLNLRESDHYFIIQILNNIEENEKFNNLLPHHKAILAILTYLKKEKYGFKQQIICKIFGISRNLLIFLLKTRNENFDYLYYKKIEKSEEIEKDKIKDIKKISKENELIMSIEKIDIKRYKQDITLEDLLEIFFS